MSLAYYPVYTINMKFSFPLFCDNEECNDLL